jgi:peptide alpha-N-acetyltransferase
MGLKNAEILLERYPDHPESNAMKALLQCGLGRQAEAVASIKKILFKNLTNFTCWHVYGIIYRKEKDYDQARRAYLNALKYNPDNDNVMRDLCQMQMHLRDFPGFMETRRQVLVKNSGSRENWTAFALGCFLN